MPNPNELVKDSTYKWYLDSDGIFNSTAIKRFSGEFPVTGRLAMQNRPRYVSIQAVFPNHHLLRSLTISIAMAVTTGTATEFPNWR